MGGVCLIQMSQEVRADINVIAYLDLLETIARAILMSVNRIHVLEVTPTRTTLYFNQYPFRLGVKGRQNNVISSLLLFSIP